MIGSRIATRSIVRKTQAIATAANVARNVRFNGAPRIMLNKSARTMSLSFHGTSQALASTSTSGIGRKPHIVLLGCGWAGMKFIYGLDSSKYDLTLVAPRDHMLFTPLLAGSSVGTAESRSVVDPVRPLLAKKGFKFFQASANTVDVKGKKVVCTPYYPDRADLEASTVELSYDYLINAVGADPATFGIPGVKENTYFLKEAADGYKIRKRLHDVFEAASLPMKSLPASATASEIAAAKELHDKEIKRLLTLVIVGGGPTGVEFAGELSDYIRDIKPLYPELANKIDLKLIASSDSIISNFNEELRNYALEYLTKTHGYEIQLNMKVLRVEKDAVVTEKETIPFGICVWSTGIAARDFTREGGLSTTPRKHAVTTDSYLRVHNGDGFIFGMGDACTITTPVPAPLPPIAQVAERQGQYLAKLFNKGHIRTLNDSVANIDYLPFRETPVVEVKEGAGAPARKMPYPAFQYFSQGMLAYIGKQNALADLMGFSGVFGPYLSKNFTQVKAFTNDPSNPVVTVKSPKHFVNDPIHLNTRGLTGFLVWRSAYISKLRTVRSFFSLPWDWFRTLLLGRDNSSINH